MAVTLTEEDLLALDARRGVYAVVNHEAGLHFRAIERASGLSVAVVKHHLDYLTKHGLVRPEQDGRNLRYYPVSFGSRDTTLMNLLRHRGVRQVLLHLLSGPCSSRILRERTSLAASTVSDALRDLTLGGIVVRTSRDRDTRYAICVDKNEIVRLLITYRASFLDTLVDRIVETWEF